MTHFQWILFVQDEYELYMAILLQSTSPSQYKVTADPTGVFTSSYFKRNRKHSESKKPHLCLHLYAS